MAVLTIKSIYSLLSLVFWGFLVVEIFQPDVDAIIRSKEYLEHHNEVLLRNKTLITIAMSLSISGSIIYYNIMKGLRENEEYKKLKNENNKKASQPIE